MWIRGSPSYGFGRIRYVATCVVAFVVATIVVAPAKSQALSTSDVVRRDEAILAARAGDYPESLTTLEALRAEHPEELSLVYDHITVLAWSNNNAAVVELAESLVPESAPRYAQLAVAKSVRNAQRFDLAASWYDAAIASNPEDIDALAGRLLTAADAGDSASVLSLIETTTALNLDSEPLALARAYGLGEIGESLKALAAYDEVLAVTPDHSEALRGKALVLRSMLLPTQALALADGHAGILTDEEIERLRADEAAIALRLRARTPYPAASLYESRDQSIKEIDDRIGSTKTSTSQTVLLLDRIVALTDANEAEAAVAQFEALRTEDDINQAYVLAAAARAYLQLRRPEEGIDLLEQAMDLDPNNVEHKFALVYTLLDLERYEAAFDLTRELTGTLPMLNRAPGSNIVKGNENRTRAELLAGITEAYGDQLEAAQSRFESLLRESPNNADFRHELANVYRWRGWLDRSLGEYRQVLTMSDDHLSAELGFAHARIDARDYPAVAAIVAEVSSSHGRDPAVEKLAERWAIHNERELSVTVSTGDSTGPVSGSDNHSINARWYTAPIAFHYRAFVTTHDSFAKFTEGEARRRRLGAGIEYRAPRFTVAGSISGSRSGGNDAGIAGEMEYRLSDFWSMNVGFEWNSDSVQLRAHRLDVESDRVFLNTRFAPSELASVDFGVERLDYSDANVLQRFHADGRFRLFNRPRSKLEATGTISFGQADSSTVPYYSPTRDRSLLAGVSHEYRLFRRYDHMLTQTIGAATGRYFQTGFASGSIWSLHYQIDWSLNQRLRLGFGAQRLGQVFDGVREQSTIGTVSVLSRF